MREIKSLLRREYEQLIELHRAQKEILEELRLIVNDHEKRLRYVERVLNYGVAGVAIVAWWLKK